MKNLILILTTILISGVVYATCLDDVNTIQGKINQGATVLANPDPGPEQTGLYSIHNVSSDPNFIYTLNDGICADLDVDNGNGSITWPQGNLIIQPNGTTNIYYSINNQIQN